VVSEMVPPKSFQQSWTRKKSGYCQRLIH